MPTAEQYGAYYHNIQKQSPAITHERGDYTAWRLLQGSCWHAL